MKNSMENLQTDVKELRTKLKLEKNKCESRKMVIAGYPMSRQWRSGLLNFGYD